MLIVICNCKYYRVKQLFCNHAYFLPILHFHRLKGIFLLKKSKLSLFTHSHSSKHSSKYLCLNIFGRIFRFLLTFIQKKIMEVKQSCWRDLLKSFRFWFLLTTILYQIKSNHFYCHITTAQVPWWVKFLRACSRQCKKKKLHMDSTYLQKSNIVSTIKMNCKMSSFTHPYVVNYGRIFFFGWTNILCSFHK